MSLKEERLNVNVIYNREKITDKVVVFVHVPCTGGNTFFDVVSRQYSDACSFDSSNVVDERSCCCDLGDFCNKRRTEVVSGHMLFGVHETLPQTNVVYITLLRHPVERIVSSYYFNCQMFDTKIRCMFNSMTLKDYVTDNMWDWNTTGYWPASTVNLQTRMVSGTLEGNLELAKDNLASKFSVVGTTERFAETMSLVGKRLGWKMNGYKNINASRRLFRSDLDDDVIEVIERKNAKDVALYLFADQFLNKQLTSETWNMIQTSNKRAS
jgi:hypothetical protein